jgi:hypothetical protein
LPQRTVFYPDFSPSSVASLVVNRPPSFVRRREGAVLEGIPIMFETLKRGGIFVAVLGSLGIIGAGCLDRPVETFIPNLKTNFTTTVENKAVDKLDLLFMIDNSASMGDKQALLALAVPDMINELVTPNCVDTMTGNNVLGVSTNGSCAGVANSKIEFPPVHDMHIGIVTSSLGSRGGDECPDNTQSPVNNALSAHQNDNGELINRGGVAANGIVDPTIEGTVNDAKANGNFLAWFPSVPANMGATAPAQPLTTVGPGTPSAAGNGDGTLIGDFSEMIEGVHEHGCGFEAQNEAWYRFLVQPDPFGTISVNSKGQSVVSGVDQTILQQRAAFLRPDSLVAIIVVTDENEEVTNPNAVFHQSWAFEATSFPGSGNGTAPEGTTTCQGNVTPETTPGTPKGDGPNSSSCTSCGYSSTQGQSDFNTVCPNGGYLSQADDFPNIRFYHQKFRFGVDAGYPTSRYTRGLTKTTVPDMCHETVGGTGPNGGCTTGPSGGPQSTYVGDQSQNANCVNPLFAENLPTDPTKELCKLTLGPRTPDLVFYAAIAGVPHQLLQAKPGDMDSMGNVECAAGSNAADCPQKNDLSAADWLLITGTDPENYDFTGADYHMVESTEPRVSGWKPDGNTSTANTSNCPPPAAGAATNATDTCDPVNGREWATSKQDLQFACTFPLVDSTGMPRTKDCTSPQYQGACDCSAMSYTAGTQLCQIGTGGTYTTTQVNGKAYPSVREMVIAHSMGSQGIVSSLCPIHTSPKNGDMPPDPLFGYRPAVTAIINRLKNALNNTCLPQKLDPDPNCGSVPCLVIATQTGGTAGQPGTCANPGSACPAGTLAPQPDCAVGDTTCTPPEYAQSVATSFCNALHTQWLATQNSDPTTDPDLRPACAIHQLVQQPTNPPSGSYNPAACSVQAAPSGDFAGGSCVGAKDQGWCYISGAAAGQCPQEIVFTAAMPPMGFSANLQCIEALSGVTGDGG